MHWNFLTVSVANLVLALVMLAVFGAALLLLFPHRTRELGVSAVVRTVERWSVTPQGSRGTLAIAKSGIWPGPKRSQTQLRRLKVPWFLLSVLLTKSRRPSASTS